MNTADTLDRLDDLISTWGTIPGAKIPVPLTLAHDIRAALSKLTAGEFELFDHLSVPSRVNPFAAAAAVNLRKGA